MLPRTGKYLRLTQGGWVATDLVIKTGGPPSTDRFESVVSPIETVSPEPLSDSRPYSPWPSIGPNYLMPDLYIGGSSFQIGLATKSRDVTDDYRLDAGVRYDFDTDYLSGRLGVELKTLGLRLTRYAISYETKNNVFIDESRYELRPYWMPFEDEDFEIAANWRAYEPLKDEGSTG